MMILLCVTPLIITLLAYSSPQEYFINKINKARVFGLFGPDNSVECSNKYTKNVEFERSAILISFSCDSIFKTSDIIEKKVLSREI